MGSCGPAGAHRAPALAVLSPPPGGQGRADKRSPTEQRQQQAPGLGPGRCPQEPAPGQSLQPLPLCSRVRLPTCPRPSSRLPWSVWRPWTVKEGPVRRARGTGLRRASGPGRGLGARPTRDAGRGAPGSSCEVLAAGRPAKERLGADGVAACGCREGPLQRRGVPKEGQHPRGGRDPSSFHPPLLASPCPSGTTVPYILKASLARKERERSPSPALAAPPQACCLTSLKHQVCGRCSRKPQGEVQAQAQPSWPQHPGPVPALRPPRPCPAVRCRGPLLGLQGRSNNLAWG